MVSPTLSLATAVNWSDAFTAIDDEPAVTAIVATAPGVTVSVTALLVTPPDAAVIWVVPAKTPVASPLLLLIWATVVALLVHVKLGLLIVSPALSLATAVNWSVAFTAIDGEPAVTVIVATAPGVTVSVIALLVTPPDEAVICVVPAKAPVAMPVLLIAATVVELLAQVKVSPLMSLPLLSFPKAENWSVAFTAIDDEAAVTAIVASVGGEFVLEFVLELDGAPPQPHRNITPAKIRANLFMTNLPLSTTE
jgi:hypothetical protein